MCVSGERAIIMIKHENCNYIYMRKQSFAILPFLKQFQKEIYALDLFGFQRTRTQLL